MPKQPHIMIVLDGLEDHSYDSLDGKTPYDFGKGANFRFIEQASAKGRLRTTPPGFEADTQTCMLTLMGVPPERIPGGRSYIESLAAKFPVGEQDLVLRCNFVKISPDGMVENPTCTPPDEIATALLEEITALPGHTWTRVGGYKSLQCIAGGREYLKNMRTYPPHDHLGDSLQSLLPSGNQLAEELAAFSRSMLQKYAPYTVLNWAQAVSCKLPSFQELHGISGGMVSKTDAPVGAAIAMGMAVASPPTATGETDTDLDAKAKAVLDMMEKQDIVILHVGGPDEATHRKDEKEKAAFVARMDQELIAPILAGCPDGTRIMLTCDHIALCSTSGHTADPVAFLLYEKGADSSAALGTFPGLDAIPILCSRSAR